MSPINLLPDDMVENHGRAVSKKRCWVCVGTALAILTAWSSLAVMHVRYLDRLIAQSIEDGAMAQEERKGADATNHELQRLTAEAQRIDQLRLPVPPAALLALLSQLIPEEVKVKQMRIQYPSVSTSESKRRMSNGVPREAGPSITVLFSGTTESNLMIPRLGNLLASQAVFTDVHIDNHRMVETANDSRWDFQISMRIALSEPDPRAGERRVSIAD